MNAKNQRKFAQNMVFNLAIGFHDLELTDMQKADARGLHKETFQIFHADCGHCPNSGWLHRLLAYFFESRHI